LRRLLPVLLLVAAGAAATGDTFVRVPGGSFRSVLKYEDAQGKVAIAPFSLMTRPVSNGQFLAFVRANPDWRRDHVPEVFAEARYLQHWAGPQALGPAAAPAQPVVNVSWFAASAYCEAQGGRLPTWNEWEYVAAADATKREARDDPAWRENILAWYSKPSNTPLAPIGQSPANAYGVQDMHGLVWEWVDDYAAMLVSGDSREQGDPDKRKFCGAGALSMDDKENYAVMMRIAMLSSLEAANTTSNVGFRCAKPLPGSNR